MRNYLVKKFPVIKKIKKTGIIINSLRNELILKALIGKRRLGNITELLLWKKLPPYIGEYGMVSCDPEFKKLANQLVSDGKICLNVREMWNIYNCVLKLKDVNGDIAEVGVYSGGSAKLTSELKSEKTLYLFDTFEGIPENDFNVNQIIDKIDGDSLPEVKSYLSKYDNVKFYQGIFPKSAESINKTNLKFSFVHLDVDVYEGTIDSLKFFYPLMSKGGVILTHDYDIRHPGVKKAFDEFFKDKSEPIMTAWDSVQGFIVKT